MADNEQKRSEEAKQIMEHPLFIEAVNKIRSDLNIEWLNSDLQNSEQRENIFVMRRMLELVVIGATGEQQAAAVVLCKFAPAVSVGF